MDFNINDDIKVKLTAYGHEILRLDFEKRQAEMNQRFPMLNAFEDKVYVPVEEDADGWSTWHLWSLMEAFGKNMHHGGNLPFETNIKLVDDTLKRGVTHAKTKE